MLGSIVLGCRSTAPAQPSPLPGSVAFGHIPVGREATRALALAWSGPEKATFRIQASGPFAVTPDHGTLSAAAPVTLRVSIKPTTPGVVKGFVAIEFTAGDVVTRKKILLNATAATPKLSKKGPPTGAEAPEQAPPQWNSWVQERPAGAPVQDVTVGRVYDVQFDLAGLDYSKSFKGVAIAGPDIDFGRELSKIPDASAEVLVVPVLLGRGLAFIDGEQTARRYTIDLRKLRQPQTAAAPNESLPDFSRRVRAMQATVGVEATEKGCAAVALTLWNSSRSQPLAHVVRELSVGGEPSCGGPASSPLKAGLLSLLALPFEKPAAAALHVFETRVGNSDPVAAVVFLEKDAEPLSWRPPRLLSEFVGADGAAGLRHQIELARCAHATGEAGCSHDYSAVAEQMRGVIFNDRTPAGQANADKALAELEELTRAAKPDVFVRLVDAQGNNIFLPLGLLGLDRGQTLGQKATLTTPMPKQSVHDPDGCVSPWRFVIPQKLTGVQDAYLKPVGDSLPATDRIVEWRDFVSYAQPTSQPTRSEGFVLLAHHTAGLVTFDTTSTDSLQPDGFKRQFRIGSVALLAGCSVGQLVGENKGLPLLTTLNNQGISAAIVSPFDIKAPVGARLAVHFADVVERARQNGERADLRTLYDRALDDTRNDPLVSAFAAELDELVLIGDSEIPLCKEGP